jgi:hypothetical protein
MGQTKKRLLVASTVTLLMGGSCSRSPDKDGVSGSTESRSADVNSISTKHQEPPLPVAESSTQGETAGKTDANSSQPRVANVAPMLRWGSDLDINSGDLKGGLVSPDGVLRYGIYESPLSREVRRLGIYIPEERDWRPMSGIPGVSRMEVMYVYPDVLNAAYQLLKLLDTANAVDSDRRSILERFMTNMRTEKWPRVIEKAHLLIVEVADRYEQESPFRPEHMEYLRQLRQEEEQAQ